MNPSSRCRAALLAPLAVLGLACNVFDDTEPAPIVIGASLPRTGELGEFGIALETGLELAAATINYGGGLLRSSLARRVEFRVLDDATTVDGAIANVEQLVHDGVPAIIGPLTSGQSLATQNISSAARVLQISPTAGAPELECAQPAVDRYLFRTVSNVLYGSAAAAALFAESGLTNGQPCRSMGIIQTDDATGQAYADAVSTLFSGTIVAKIEIPASEVIDYSAPVGELVAAAPDCTLLVAFAEAAVQILSEFRSQTSIASTHDWTDFFWLGTTSLHTQTFIDASARHPSNPAEGVYGVDEDTAPLTLEYGELRGTYNAFFGRPSESELSPFVSNTYDAAMLIALAIEYAGTVNAPDAIRDGLWAVSGTDGSRTIVGPTDFAEAVTALGAGTAIHYKGASSQLVFNKYGSTLSTPSIVWKLEGGRFTIVKRYSDEDIGRATEALLGPPDCATE